MRKHDQYRSIVVLLAGALLSACNSSHTLTTPIKPGSSGERYLAEFKKMPYSEAPQAVAPDGSAKIEDRKSSSLPFSFLAGCHEVWYVPGAEDGQKILAAREVDRGSGRSFSWGWSRDSKAIFIRGAHAGLDCRGPRGHLSIIYTVADGTAWEAPNE